VVHLAGVLPTPPTWKDFNLYEAVRRFEARVIERALRDVGGVLARAAQLLGINRQALTPCCTSAATKTSRTCARLWSREGRA
jgi:DNA-binding NtrC family response regulator